MSLIDGLAELLFPTRCAGCELPGAVLCDRCREDLARIQPAGACQRCGAPYGHLVCTECWSTEWAFEAALAVGSLEAPLSRAIVLHKDSGERRLAAVFGALLAEQVDVAWPSWPECVAYVPATATALRRRGFDHGRAIAVSLGEEIGVPVEHALRRTAARDQRELGRLERAANAAGTVHATGAVRGRVLLCDDVFTTGATLDAAAAVLLLAGADAVRIAAVARAW